MKRILYLEISNFIIFGNEKNYVRTLKILKQNIELKNKESKTITSRSDEVKANKTSSTTNLIEIVIQARRKYKNQI